MGQIAKKISPTTTRYYWYPGDTKEWIRAGVAVGAGLAVLGIVAFLTRSPLAAAVSATTTTATVGGFNFGRRDSRALVGFADLSRRAAIAHAGRAAWRAVVEGLAGASAAVLIANLAARGLAADWLLPLVPAVVGALAHQAGMLYERLGHASAAASTHKPVLDPTPQPSR